MNDDSQASLRNYLAEFVLETISDIDLSGLPVELRGVALADEIARLKAMHLLGWDMMEEAPLITPDPVLDELLAEGFDELLDARLNLMEALTRHEGVNAQKLEGVKVTIRLLRQKKLDRNQVVMGLHMFFFGCSTVMLELPTFGLPLIKSDLWSSFHTGTEVLWRKEVREICLRAKTKNLDTVLAAIENREYADDSVFRDIDWDKEIIRWATKAGKIAKFKFSTLEYFLAHMSL